MKTWKWISCDRGNLLVTGDESEVILQSVKRVVTHGEPSVNANLIAAAPDLLVVAVEAKEIFQRLAGEMENPKWLGILERLTIAIAKAEGKK